MEIARYSLNPVGQNVETDFSSHPAGNTLWALFIGAVYGLACLVLMAVFCATVILIPLGVQYLKLARLYLSPFGAEIYDNADKINVYPIIKY